MSIRKYSDFESNKEQQIKIQDKIVKEEVLLPPKRSKSNIEILEENIIKFNSGDIKDILETIKNEYPEIDYFIREKDNQIHIVKYNQSLRLDINEFVNSLLKFYSRNENLKNIIQGIKVKGNTNFSIVENMNSKNTFKFVDDLTKLLSKKNKI